MNPLLKIACDFAAASLQGQRAAERPVDFGRCWRDAEQAIRTMPEPYKSAMAQEMREYEFKHCPLAAPAKGE